MIDPNKIIQPPPPPPLPPENLEPEPEALASGVEGRSYGGEH